MDNLKITAKMMSGQVATYDGYLPLDGILAASWIREHYPDTFDMPMDYDNMITAELPLEKRGAGNDWYWACSFACFKSLQETRRYWHKRFDQGKAEEYVDFGKRRGAVDVRSGRYKNYRMPLNIMLIPEINWYAVGDKGEIEHLLQRITHIGKKASQGLGLVREWTVEKIGEDLSGLRPMPDENGHDYIGIRPPYWYFENYRRVEWPDDDRIGARIVSAACEPARV